MLELIEELTTEEYRQKLAGLIDEQEQQSSSKKKELREMAILFAAALPEVFGEELDRITMWDRIGTGLQIGFAKVAGSDYEFFIQQVLEHIKADPSKASRNESIANVMEELSKWNESDLQAWITYFNSHLIPILVHARSRWTKTKEERKKK